MCVASVQKMVRRIIFLSQQVIASRPERSRLVLAAKSKGGAAISH
jgi:hypothetical protein